MIRELVKLVEKEIGVSIPSDSYVRIEARICASFSGERIPAYPKIVTMQRVIDIGTATPSRDLAKKIGVSIRTVQRAKKLLRA